MAFREGVTLSDHAEAALGPPNTGMPERVLCPAMHPAYLVTVSVTKQDRSATFPCYPCWDCNVIYRLHECGPWPEE